MIGRRQYARQVRRFFECCISLRISPAVSLLASRDPVSSRFLAVCRGGRENTARRHLGEHVALSFLGRNFRSSPCKPPFRAKDGSFVFDFYAAFRFSGRGAPDRDGRGLCQETGDEFFPTQFSRIPAGRMCGLSRSVRGIFRAFQLSMPSWRVLSILDITLRERAHGEEARVLSALTRCVR